MKPPCTERYARWCERTAVNHRLLLDLVSIVFPKIRVVCIEEKEGWYFSIVDVAAVLTEQGTTRGTSNYWKALKSRLKKD